jgi:hypothetical protein
LGQALYILLKNMWVGRCGCNGFLFGCVMVS